MSPKPITGGSGGAAGIEVALPHPGTSRPAGLTRFLESERLLAALLLSPTVILLGLFIAYPFVMGVWLSLSNTSVGNPGTFVGIHNFVKAWNDSIFQTAFRNTVFYTFWATIFKLTLGMWLALLLNRNFHGKRIVRASMLLPFIVPTVLSTFAWRWMFDPTFSVLNWLLYQTGFITTKLPFLSDGTYGMWCAIVVNTWRGMPFFAISLLAGLQTISPDLHEAASLDGANGWHRFWQVTWPLLKPVTLVVVVFSVIQTFSDFQLIYVLTGGGPANATHLLATYAYQIGVATGLLGEGAAISLFMLPVLFLVVWLQLRYLRRLEGV
ncbi:MAG TPA: sugar ABC transporter permease [Candidatus Methylomirabilis sp.]|nr:sugar ABC transporter permease [Candidatus Methylomirabilis sp.]